MHPKGIHQILFELNFTQNYKDLFFFNFLAQMHEIYFNSIFPGINDATGSKRRRLTGAKPLPNGDECGQLPRRIRVQQRAAGGRTSAVVRA